MNEEQIKAITAQLEAAGRTPEQIAEVLKVMEAKLKKAGDSQQRAGGESMIQPPKKEGTELQLGDGSSESQEWERYRSKPEEEKPHPLAELGANLGLSFAEGMKHVSSYVEGVQLGLLELVTPGEMSGEQKQAALSAIQKASGSPLRISPLMLRPSKEYDPIIDKLEEYTQEHDNSITEEFLKGNYIEGARRGVNSAFRSAFSIAAAATGVGGLAVLGASAAGGKFEEEFAKDPSRSTGNLVLNATGTGITEASFEIATRGLLKKAGWIAKQGNADLARKILETGAKEIVKNLTVGTAKAMGKEGVSEAATELTISLMDALPSYTGVGLGKKIDSTQLLYRTGDAFITGAIMGGGISSVGTLRNTSQAAKDRAEKVLMPEYLKYELTESGKNINKLAEDLVKAKNKEEKDLINKQVEKENQKIKDIYKTNSSLLSDLKGVELKKYAQNIDALNKAHKVYVSAETEAGKKLAKDEFIELSVKNEDILNEAHRDAKRVTVEQGISIEEEIQVANEISDPQDISKLNEINNELEGLEEERKALRLSDIDDQQKLEEVSVLTKRINRLTTLRQGVIKPAREEIIKRRKSKQYKETVDKVKAINESLPEDKRIDIVEDESTVEEYKSIALDAFIAKEGDGMTVARDSKGNYVKGKSPDGRKYIRNGEEVVVTDTEAAEIKKAENTLVHGYIDHGSKGQRSRIIINRAAALEGTGMNVASHEFLHYMLEGLFQSNPEVSLAIGEMFGEYLSTIDINQVKDNRFKARIEAYRKKQGDVVAAEESLNLFIDAIANDAILSNETMWTKIKDTIRRLFQSLGMTVKLGEGREVFNFLKDFQSNIEKGRMSTGLRKVFADGIEVVGEAKTRVTEKATTKEAIEAKTEEVTRKRLLELFETIPGGESKVKDVRRKYSMEPGLDLKDTFDRHTLDAEGNPKFKSRDDFLQSDEYIEAWTDLTETNALNGLILKGMTDLGLPDGTAKDDFVRKVKDRLQERFIKNYDPTIANGSLFGWLTGAAGGGQKGGMIFRSKQDVKKAYLKEVKTVSSDETMGEDTTFGEMLEADADVGLEALEGADLSIGSRARDKNVVDVLRTEYGVVFTESVGIPKESVQKINNIVKQSDIDLTGLDYKGLKLLVTDVADVILENGKKKRPSKESDVRALGPLYGILEIISEEFNIPAARILAQQNLTSQQRLNAQRYIKEHAVELMDMLPDGGTRSGMATGIAHTSLGELYTKGERVRAVEGQGTQGRYKQTLDIIRDVNEEYTQEQIEMFLDLFGIKPDGGFDSHRNMDSPIRALATQAAVITANQAVRKQAIENRTHSTDIINLVGVGKNKIMYSMETPMSEDIDGIISEMHGHETFRNNPSKAADSLAKKLATTKSNVLYTMPGSKVNANEVNVEDITGWTTSKNKAILVVGGAGSGKSALISGLAKRSKGFTVVNADAMVEVAASKKGLDLDYNKMSDKQRREVDAMYTKSNKAANEAKLQGMRQNKGLLIEVGTSDSGVVIKQAKKLKDSGYEVKLITVDTDLETAIKRNKSRSRTLEDTDVEHTFNVFDDNINALKKEFGAEVVEFKDGFANVEKQEKLNAEEFYRSELNPAVKAIEDELILIAADQNKSRVRFSEEAPEKMSNIIEEQEKDLDKLLNQMISRKTGVSALAEFNRAQAMKEGRNKGRMKFFIPPSADDFAGLMYSFLGEGEKGDQDAAWFKEVLYDPFARGIRRVNSIKQVTSNDVRNLKKDMLSVTSNLKKEVGDSGYTYEDAIRVYNWKRDGHEVPGLSPNHAKLLNELVTKDKNILKFANKLYAISQRPGGVAKPGDFWLGGTISSDMFQAIKAARQSALQEWVNNKDIIFSEKNLNKIQAVYGENFRLALEDVLERMEFGGNVDKSSRGGKQRYQKALNKTMFWINGSIGATMFLNSRSAALQLISTVNFLNWTDNNPLKAAKAFANQKQYWSDVLMIFNSNFLKQRRSGLAQDINASEFMDFVENSDSPYQAALGFLLKIGFTPTQAADSLAIAAGGSTFYRNRVETYVAEGMSQADAESKAFIEMMEIAEESQQSSREDRVSQQQASVLGKFGLAFQNTPMQYNRLIKKAFLDLKNGRGDAKTHVSRILYYSTVQNAIFYALQTALFAVAFGDDEEKLDKKTNMVINGMIDSLLRGSGLFGGIVATLKNTYLKWVEERDKGYQGKSGRALVELFNASPPIGIKARKIYNAMETEKFNRDVIEYMSYTDLHNPIYDASSSALEGLTNIPVNRLYKKVNNLNEAMSSELTALQRFGLALGWSKWNLGIENGGTVEEAKEQVKLIKSWEKKTKKKQKSEKQLLKDWERAEEKSGLENSFKEQQKEERKKGKKDIKCAAISGSGNRCSLKVEGKSSYCTIHQKVEQSSSGAKKQCKHIKDSGKRCKMKTSSKSGLCYYHD